MTTIIDGSGSAEFHTALPVAEGGTGATASTGSGNVVLSASPTLTGTIGAAALTLTTPLPVASGGTGTTTGGLGVGQSWSDVSGSRSANTTYTNSTGKPIQVNVWGGGGNGLVVSLTVGSVLVGQVGGNGDVSSHKVFVSAIVPAGATYIAQNNGNNLGWAELR